MILLAYQLLFNDAQLSAWQLEVIPEEYRERLEGRAGYFPSTGRQRSIMYEAIVNKTRNVITVIIEENVKLDFKFFHMKKKIIIQFMNKILFSCYSFHFKKCLKLLTMISQKFWKLNFYDGNWLKTEFPNEFIMLIHNSTKVKDISTLKWLSLLMLNMYYSR